MPADRGLMASIAAPETTAPLARSTVREAARWLARLRDEGATEADRAACDSWRAALPENERAWQRAEEINRRFGLIPPALGSRVLARSLAPGRRAGLKALGLLAVAAPTGWMAQRTDTWQAWTADERTAVGERRALRLADGSRVHLNTHSAIDVAFDAERRLLRLRLGELLVETAPDPKAGEGRPFLVQTADGVLQALGTRFTVRQEPGATRVAVLQGEVAVRPHAAGPVIRRLPAGQQLRFTADGRGDTEALTPDADAWSRGMLIARRMRLADFATELARHRPGLLRCDPAVADLRLSGAFQLADTDRVLSAVAATLPIAVVYRTRYWVSITGVALTALG